MTAMLTALPVAQSYIWHTSTVNVAAQQTVEPSAPSVVVIDDEAYICALVSDILEEEGYTVAIARNGVDGLRAIVALQPSLIITDIMMPGMSGLDVVEQVRHTPSVADTPVIMMSAGRQPLNLAHDVRFIAKPFDILLLLKRVEELVGSAQ